MARIQRYVQQTVSTEQPIVNIPDTSRYIAGGMSAIGDGVSAVGKMFNQQAEKIRDRARLTNITDATLKAQQFNTTELVNARKATITNEKQAKEYLKGYKERAKSYLEGLVGGAYDDKSADRIRAQFANMQIDTDSKIQLIGVGKIDDHTMTVFNGNLNDLVNKGDIQGVAELYNGAVQVGMFQHTPETDQNMRNAIILATNNSVAKLESEGKLEDAKNVIVKSQFLSEPAKQKEVKRLDTQIQNRAAAENITALSTAQINGDYEAVKQIAPLVYYDMATDSRQREGYDNLLRNTYETNIFNSATAGDFAAARDTVADAPYPEAWKFEQTEKLKASLVGDVVKRNKYVFASTDTMAGSIVSNVETNISNAAEYGILTDDEVSTLYTSEVPKALAVASERFYDEFGGGRNALETTIEIAKLEKERSPYLTESDVAAVSNNIIKIDTARELSQTQKQLEEKNAAVTNLFAQFTAPEGGNNAILNQMVSDSLGGLYDGDINFSVVSDENRLTVVNSQVLNNPEKVSALTIWQDVEDGTLSYSDAQALFKKKLRRQEQNAAMVGTNKKGVLTKAYDTIDSMFTPVDDGVQILIDDGRITAKQGEKLRFTLERGKQQLKEQTIQYALDNDVDAVSLQEYAVNEFGLAMQGDMGSIVSSMGTMETVREPILFGKGYNTPYIEKAEIKAKNDFDNALDFSRTLASIIALSDVTEGNLVVSGQDMSAAIGAAYRDVSNKKFQKDVLNALTRATASETRNYETFYPEQ